MQSFLFLPPFLYSLAQLVVYSDVVPTYVTIPDIVNTQRDYLNPDLATTSREA